VFQDYIRRELKWNSDMFYTVTANVRPWDQGPVGGPAEALRSAMTQQTYLKLLVVCGYYDLATPYNGIETTVSHMMLEPSVRKNVSFTYYEAGHMMYIDKKAREKLHRDIDSWIQASSGPVGMGGGSSTSAQQR
jgi:carboxypeptidase C (cathepsin A)